MDLESERSIEDNESLETESFDKNGEIYNKLKNNGKFYDEVKDEGSVVKSKGRGLRKWRRIRRESGKKTSSNFDSNKKRGMTALPGGNKLRSEGSSSSTNAVSNVFGNVSEHIPFYGLDLGSKADSENSEDRNSRSSTAASAPRMINELAVVGLGLDRNTMRSLSGMNSGIMLQQPGDQQEKGRNVKKKARGGKIKKENSISSMESDSRSNFFVLQGANSLMRNGKGSGRSGNYEEDDSDDDQNGDGHLNDVSQTAFSKNEARYEDVSLEDLARENSWEIKEEKVDDLMMPVDHGALLESIIPLRLAQEALEREVQKLRDVGKEDNDRVQPSGLNFSEEEFGSLKINDIHFQKKLEEALVMLESKNTKIFELESALNFEEINIKQEELMTQRIAAELEYLVISNKIQNLKSDLDRTNHTVQQKNVQEQVHLEGAGKTNESTTTLQNRVGRYAYCFTIQSVLLLVVMCLFVSRFSFQNVEVIPT